MQNNIFQTVKNQTGADPRDFELLLTKIQSHDTVSDRSIVRGVTPSPFFRWIFVGVAASAAAFVISIFNFNSNINSGTDINDAILAVNEAVNTNRTVMSSAIINEDF
jgi:hypothetical protein